MATRNELDCLTTLGNTGFGTCILDFKNIIGAIRLPKDAEIDITDLQTALTDLVCNDSKALRGYPFFDFKTPTDNTEDLVVQTFADGSKKPVREGFNDWKFQYVDGGLSLHKNLRTFNGLDADFLFIDGDSPNKIMCLAGSAADKIKGIPVAGGFFWAHPWKLNTGAAVAEYMVQFTMPVKYTNDEVNFVVADFDVPSTIKGLQDVDLTLASGGTSGVFNATLLTSTVNTNLGDVYPTELAAGGLWTAKNTATGTAITISSVSYDEDNKYFIVTLATTAPPYPASGTVTINLAAPSVLAAAGVLVESTGAKAIARN